MREYRLKNPFPRSDPDNGSQLDAEEQKTRPAATPAGRQTLTVSEFAEQIKSFLEGAFPYGIWVEGELSDPKIWSSGHLYFTLKDERAGLRCMMWASDVQGLKFEPEQGLKVVCYGKPDFYGPRGELSFKVRQIEPKGIGALQLAFDQMVARLEKEGLFSPEHKQPLPNFPRRVGVVTSPSGAAIDDMLKLLRDQVEVVLYPCRVQGATAAASIVRGIEVFNQTGNVDLVIVGRGGGSLEDLWAFNEEPVARAVFSSRLPVISAVGHEKDIAISDMTADQRATTPTNAAEIVLALRARTQERLARVLDAPAFTEPETWLAELQEKVEDLEGEMVAALEEPLFTVAHRLQVLKGELLSCSPQAFILHQAEHIVGLQGSLAGRMHHWLAGLTAEVHGLAGRLHALSPLAVLERGYSITFDEEGKVLKEAARTKPGALVETRLHRGKIKARVESIGE